MAIILNIQQPILKPKAVLRSIKPYYFYLICEGIKKVELGKNMPKSEGWNKEVYLYCSKDIKSFKRIPKEFKNKYRKYLGNVGAKFVCGFSYTFNVENQYLCGPSLEALQLTHQELCDYANNKTVYGWGISDLVVYNQPIELSSFKSAHTFGRKLRTEFFGEDPFCVNNYRLVRPPQSWCYVENNKEVKNV